MFSIQKMKDEYYLNRLMVMILGNVIMALGSAFFNLALMGMHPFNSFAMAVCTKLGMSYGTFSVLESSALFVIQFIWGRRYIGAGTFFNWIVLGYIVTFWSWLIPILLPFYQETACRYVFLVFGIVILSFSLSVYQSADMGIAPFDAMSLILADRTPFPYFWCRLFTDLVAALCTFFAGGILGLGSILFVFCLGPFIAFFNRNFSDRYLKKCKEVRDRKALAAKKA